MELLTMKKIIIVAVCLIIAALSIYKISGYLLEMLESQNLNDSLTKEAVMKLPQDAESNQSEQESVQETAPIIVDFEVLQTENKDIIAWLHCPDTKINYPVAQSEDNSYWNTAGTIFMDYRNSADFSDRHTVIYGHNMKNDTTISLSIAISRMFFRGSVIPTCCSSALSSVLRTMGFL